ncbi:hypothetical protein EON63_01760 [archaeon]|nr:MAG: hypothetical protein EON63_01760 [archaeon]
MATDYTISRRKSGVYKIPPPLPPSLPLTSGTLSSLPSLQGGSYHLHNPLFPPPLRSGVASGVKTWVEASRQKKLRVSVHRVEDHSVTPANSPHSK